MATMRGRRGGSSTEQRLGARVATNDGVANTAGYGRGEVTPPPPARPAVHGGRTTMQNDPRIVKPPLAHKPDNIVVDDKLEINFAFQPNILDNYDSYTYHWKLFIVDPASAANGTILKPKNQTIIAESGVTDLTIDKVDIRGVVTPSIETGTGVATEVKFEITEPSGAGLIDKIFYQSIGLGIGNWAVMPLYLQLQFRARDPESSEALKDGADGSISSLKWIWPLKISNIKANVSTVGTRYDFSAIIYNELAQSNAYFVMLNAVVLRNLKTVSDAMSELEDKLNEDQLLRLIDNYSIPDVFRIVVDPNIAGEGLYDFSNNTDSSRSNSFTAMSRKDATFGPGTSVDKIIDAVLAHTPKFQKSGVGSNTPGEEGRPASEEPSQMKKMWRIITESRPLQFDPRRMDDAREFTIYVVEYDIGVLDSNVFQDSDGVNTIAAERKRLATYLKKNILKKRYNYIFTGLNDQIINFDLTLNNAFAVAQSRMGGIYSNIAMSSTGVAYQDTASEEAAVTEKVRAAISFMNTAEPDIHNATTFKNKQEAVTASINASSLPEETKRRYITLLEQAKSGNKAVYLNTLAYGERSTDGKINLVRKEAISLAKPVQELSFVSDVNTNLTDPTNSRTIEAYNSFLKNAKGKLRPIAHTEQLQDNQFMGLESSNNSGIQKLASMYSVALHSGLDASFQRIKITIKGDPFWIFPQPFVGEERPYYNSLKSPAEAIDWIKNAHYRASGINTYGTDNFLMIRFRTPRIYTEEETESEKDSFNEVATFSGVYKVVMITNNFASGKFTQDLDCILDPFINILNFSTELNNTLKVADVPTTVSDLISKNVGIPPTAVKAPKIESPIPEKGVPDDVAAAVRLNNRMIASQREARAEAQQLTDAIRRGKTK